MHKNTRMYREKRNGNDTNSLISLSINTCKIIINNGMCVCTYVS